MRATACPDENSLYRLLANEPVEVWLIPGDTTDIGKLLNRQVGSTWWPIVATKVGAAKFVPQPASPGDALQSL
jgi:hypothetical protein